jgi:hypothetical protein
MALRDLMRHWVVAHRIFQEDEPYLENLIVVRFERLIREPDACLRDVYDYLGVEALPTEREIRPTSNERYFERWQEELGSPERAAPLELLRREFGSEVRKLGYSLDELDVVADGYARRAVGSRA